MYRPGVIVDESSGSTGRPYNWVRGPQELKAIYRSVAGYVSLAFPGEKLFVINAYSMGAWATGTTTGNALSRIAMVKNTGPDLEKIVDTLVHFGPAMTTSSRLIHPSSSTCGTGWTPSASTGSGTGCGEWSGARA